MSEKAGTPRFLCMVNAFSQMNCGRRAWAVCVLCATTAIAQEAQTLTTLVSFDGTDGESPAYAGLVQATDGNAYGTTELGGANDKCNGGCGTVFKMTPNGTLTTLYNFCPLGYPCPDGQWPNDLVQATDGNFYGTTQAGGVESLVCGFGSCGTVFKITPGGRLTTLYSFCSKTNCTDGKLPPAGGLFQATNGNFYGTTAGGGANDGGTFFQMTPGGTLTTLYSFCSQTNCTDEGPILGLVQATDANFYGTTPGGGTYAEGTIFKITASGTLTTLYNFCSQTGCPDGFQPYAPLFQATNGNFYGTTASGGAPSTVCSEGCGTVFNLSVGLGRFVRTLPASGEVGKAIKVLGGHLTGATSVTFNGTPSTFTVVSASEITTKVPTGATTGPVEVVTPSGTLSSNVPFQVP